MNMQPVRSSNISSVGYDNGLMHIRFNSGGVYAYYNVPQTVYNGLISAASVGSYFHSFVKGRYGDTKIG